MRLCVFDCLRVCCMCVRAWLCFVGLLSWLLVCLFVRLFGCLFTLLLVDVVLVRLCMFCFARLVD